MQHARKYIQKAAGLLLFALSLESPEGFSQIPTATILGVVRDATGAVIPQAELTARNVETGQTRATVTGADGSYRFSALSVGNYEVQVEHTGFQSAVRSGLTLTVGREAIVNFNLQVGAVEQRVEVTAEAPLVNTTTGTLGGLVDEQKVAELPLNGRNFVDLALLQTGVQKSRIRTGGGSIDGTAYSSNGAPLASNNATLDGARVNSFGSSSTATSGTGNTLGIEGIQEFRVVTNALSAEYGMAMGSQMMIVSKSGTNSFHGSLFEYHRNDDLDARNFFDYGATRAVNPRRIPPFVRNNFGGSLGGPIVQDRTFFHTNLELLRERKSDTRVSDVIDPRCKVDGGCVPQINPAVRNWLDIWPNPNLSGNRFADNPSSPLNQQYGQFRIDHNFSESDSLFGRYTVDDSDRIQPRNLPGVGSQSLTRAQYITLSENHVVSPTVINQARFSYSRNFVNQLSAYDDPRLAEPGPGLSLVAGQRLGEISVGDLTAFNPRTSEPVFFEQQIYTWSDDLFVTRGAHALKFGVLINKFNQFVSLLNDAIGLIEFDDTLSMLRGEPVSFRSATPGSEFARDVRFTTLGFYVQDDWKVRQNLTLNLGMRYEFSTQPNEVSGHNGNLRNITDPQGTLGIPFENNSKKNFSPRIGFAWDVMGDSMTAVRGGFGFLYDLGNMGTAIRYGALNPPFGSLSALDEDQFTQPFTLPIVYPPGSAGKDQEIVDFHMKQPRTYQWNLTVERQLPAAMALSVGYVGTRGVRLLQPREGNPRIPNSPSECGGQRCWLSTSNPRVSPHWDSVIMITAGGGSWYNGMQVGLSKRLGSGLQFQTSYTWSVAMDDVQGQFASEFNSTSGDMGADPGNMRYDWNPAAFDYRHNLVSNAIYRLPNFISSGGFAGGLLNGWWVGGIVTTNTGFPLTPVINNQWSQSGIRGSEVRIDRPNLKADRSYDSIVLGGPDKYFDPTAFELQPRGFKGNSQRGGIRGPGFATVDFSLVKDTPVGFLGEAGKLEFRAEFFNLFNRVNFGIPERRVFAGALNRTTGLPDQTIRAGVGRISSTLLGGSPSRQVQLALKLVF